MNINKFTQKSMEAVQNCEKLAYEYGNQQIDQPHLLYSLLTLDDSLIMKLYSPGTAPAGRPDPRSPRRHRERG